MEPIQDQQPNQNAEQANQTLFFSDRQSNGQVSATLTVARPVGERGDGKGLPLGDSPAATVPNDVLPIPAPEADVALDGETPPSKEASGRSRRPIILVMVGIGVVVVAVYGYRWWQFSATHETTDNATLEGHVHAVSSRVNGTIAAVLVQDNQWVQVGQTLIQLDPRDFEVAVQQAQAALEAARRKASSAQSTIGVTAQTAQGQTAQARGDVGSAIAAIDSAQALLRDANAGVPTAEAAVTEAQAGVAVAQAQVAQANANLKKLAADYRRYTSLYQSGAIAKQQLDEVQNAYEVALAAQHSAQQTVLQAQAKVTQAQQGVNSAQAKVAQAQQGIASSQANLAKSRGGLEQAKAATLQTGVSQGDYGAAQSAIAQAEANLKAAQLQLTYTRITAPTSGRVGRKNAEVGDRVQPGSQLLAVVDPQVWVTANFKETQLERIRPGEAVEVVLDAFPHHVFRGRVQSLSPASGAEFSLLPPDNATGNFTKVVQRIPVKITLEQDSTKGYESRLTPGMSAEVSVTVR